MDNVKFTEMQIIDVRLSSIELVTELERNVDFQEIKQHLNKFWIRLETCIDLQLMGRDFYLKPTTQVSEQAPELIDTLNLCVERWVSTNDQVGW